MALKQRITRVRRSVRSGIATASSAASRCFRLGIETLEERAVPATLVVNTALDNTLAGDGMVTLREAIIAANTDTVTDLGHVGSGADVIQFDPALRGETIRLVLGQLAISSALTINGLGAQDLTINASRLSRIFDVNASGAEEVVIRGLTLTDGTAPEGGAILSRSGNLTVADAVITGNTSTGGGGDFSNTVGAGGGIKATFDSRLTIANSVIADNQSLSFGGGISAAYSTIIDTVVSGNMATRSGGGIASWASLNILRGTITGNVAHREGDLLFLEAGGGGIFSENDLVVTDTTVTGNTAGVNGGGIYSRVWRPERTVLLSGCTITDNTVLGSGGGIFLDNQLAFLPQIRIDACNVSNNTASGRGGGLYIFESSHSPIAVSDSVFSDNSAFSGGGIEADQIGRIDLQRVIVTNNKAENTGGGIYFLDTVSATITDSTISDNVTYFGGGIATLSLNVRPAVFELINSTVSGNTGVIGSGWWGFGSLDARIIGSTFSGNVAATVNGIEIEDVATGAAVAIESGFGFGSVTLTLQSSILANTTDLTGGRHADLVSLGELVNTVNVDHSLIETVATGTINGTNEANVIGVDPLLGPLADNGGPTLTHLPLPGSPVISRGSNPLGLPYDQRGEGFARQVGPGVDIGAIEFADDALPTVRIDDVQALEGEKGLTAFTFTVKLSAPGSDAVTVGYATADGTATAGRDYTAASGTLTFAPGETSKTITVWVLGDKKKETDKTFFVNLSGAINALIDDDQGMGTILDDDKGGAMNADSTGWGTQTFTVSLNPDDPQFTNGSLYGMTKIQAPAAWDTTTGSTSIVVADIDTGIDYTHEDLYLNIWINQGEIPASRRANLTDIDGDGFITFRDLNNPINQGWMKVNDTDGNGRIDARDILAAMTRLLTIDTGGGGWADGSDTDGNGYVDDLIGWDFVNNDNRPFDDHGHGTHTAGTIGAIGNNGIGVVGVNWAVQIMPLKFLDASGRGTDVDAIEAIRYAADNGARVSNNSWGGYFGTTGDPLYQAIEYAGTKGHLFIAAAGNDGVNNDRSPYRSFPASYDLPNIISVAATDSKDNRPRWSNYGKTSVDLGAPGVGILSTVPGGYLSASGTSMAAPHVTGAAALVLSTNPNLTAEQVKEILLGTVDPVRSLRKEVVSEGRLNVARAVAAAGGTALPPSSGGTSDPAPEEDNDPITLPGLPIVNGVMSRTESLRLAPRGSERAPDGSEVITSRSTADAERDLLSTPPVDLPALNQPPAHFLFLPPAVDEAADPFGDGLYPILVP